MATNYSPRISTEGLRTFIDTGNIKSYPGSGDVIYDISGHNHHFTGTAAYVDRVSIKSGAQFSADSSDVLNTDTYSMFFWIKFKGTETYPNGHDGTFRKIFQYAPAGTDRSPGIWRYHDKVKIHWTYHPNPPAALNQTTLDFSPVEGYFTAPEQTEWNIDGWSNLTNLNQRTYKPFVEASNTWYHEGTAGLGDVVVDREYILHDIINDKYYKVDFSSWQKTSGGGFAYTRTQIHATSGATIGSPVSFTRTGGTEQEDPIDTNVTLRRGTNGPLYNSALEGSATWAPDVYFSLNTWYHVGEIKNGALGRAYVNGQYVRGSTILANPKYAGNAAMYIWPDYPVNMAEMNTLMIYNRVLSSTEIRQNFDAVRGRFGV